MRKRIARRKQSHKILGVISEQQAEQLLTDWANVPVDWPMKFENPQPITPGTFRGGAFGSWDEMETAARAHLASQPAAKVSRQDPMQQFADAIEYLRYRYRNIFPDSRVLGVLGHPWLREFLRKAWGNPDPRACDWYLFRFRDLYQVMARRIDMTVEEIRDDEMQHQADAPRFTLPPATAVEAAAVYFQHNAARALRCKNPACKTPFFFASKKSQKFCSTDCSLPSMLAAKRTWWRVNKGRRRR